jgi:FtsP/CotA-like multicopper oxidase with cupredoxin domain
MAAHIAQEPIANGGGVYRYEFTAVQSGTCLYRTHDRIDRQQALGLYGALIHRSRRAEPGSSRGPRIRCAPAGIHGGPFKVLAVDGNTLPASARYDADTVSVGPGQRYDVIWTARAAAD